VEHSLDIALLVVEVRREADIAVTRGGNDIRLVQRATIAGASCERRATIAPRRVGSSGVAIGIPAA
jgi:hypothetical protein